MTELRLSRIAEPLARLAGGAAGLDQEPLLGHAWRTLLQSQFHDTLAGTTCDEAQREQAVRLDAVNTTSRALAAASLEALVTQRGIPPGEAGSLLLWNPLARPRAGLVIASLTFFRSDVLVGPPSGRKPRVEPGAHPFAIATREGRIPVQVLANRITDERRDDLRRYPDQDEVDRIWAAFEVGEVPGLGLLAAEPVASARPVQGPALVTAPDTLENRHLAITTSPIGTLSLRDAESGRSVEGLGTWLDEPDQGDLYTFSRGGPADRGRHAPLGQHVLASGPLVGAIATRWAMTFRSGKASARTVVSLHRDSALIRLRLELHHWGADHRLRLQFPVGPGRVIAGGVAGIDQEAPPGPAQNVFEEREVSTRPAHRFVAATAQGITFAVFAPGCFEYEWTRSGELLITVLRAVGQLSKGDLTDRPGHAAWPIGTPEAQESGLHLLELGLACFPETGDLAALLERSWEDLFLPIQAFYRRR